MNTSDQCIDRIQSKVKQGCYPTEIFRKLLQEDPALSKSDLAGLFMEAFDLGDGVVYNFLWNWPEKQRSMYWDREIDLGLLWQVVQSGAEIPWDEERIHREHEEMQSWEKEPLMKKPRDVEHSIESLTKKLQSFERRVACIQALWDGDTEGWFIRLSAFLFEGERFREAHLGLISFGGDGRLFSGAVPPWPEAVRANELGSALALDFHAEFYFPSPDKPDIDLPEWRGNRA